MKSKSLKTFGTWSMVAFLSGDLEFEVTGGCISSTRFRFVRLGTFLLASADARSLCLSVSGFAFFDIEGLISSSNSPSKSPAKSACFDFFDAGLSNTSSSSSSSAFSFTSDSSGSRESGETPGSLPLLLAFFESALLPFSLAAAPSLTLCAAEFGSFLESSTVGFFLLEVDMDSFRK